jgi:hypothetical protein
MFEKFGIDVSGANDAAVLKAFNSILDAAAIMARPSGDLFRALRDLNDFAARPRLDPEWNLDRLLSR